MTTDRKRCEEELLATANMLFAADKPEHFTNYRHCCECAEHDETLRSAEIETIGLEELGNQGWDPLCFCSEEGKKYYLPALLRLSIDTIDSDFYFAQLLFHLEYDGDNNRLFQSCSKRQRAFIASFLKHMIETYTEQIEQGLCSEEALRTYEIWSKE